MSTATLTADPAGADTILPSGFESGGNPYPPMVGWDASYDGSTDVHVSCYGISNFNTVGMNSTTEFLDIQSIDLVAAGFPTADGAHDGIVTAGDCTVTCALVPASGTILSGATLTGPISFNLHDNPNGGTFNNISPSDVGSSIFNFIVSTVDLQAKLALSLNGSIGTGSFTITDIHKTYTYTLIEIDNVFPDQGGPVGDALVQINGSGFQNGVSNITNIYFDGIAATSISVLSNGAVECRTPAHAPAAVDVSIEFTDPDNSNIVSITKIAAYTYQSFTWTLDQPDNPVASGDPITVTSDPNDPNHIDFTKIDTVTVVYDVDGTPTTIDVPEELWITVTVFLFIFDLPDLTADEPPIISILVTSTEFSGSVSLGKLITIYFVNAPGIYKLVPGKTSDTLYDITNGGTVEAKIPNPTAKTGFVGG